MERKISEKGTREIDIKKNAGEDETQLTFSLRLNALLKEKKMSQKDFADKTGLSVGAISNYCSGKRLPGGIEFVDILDKLKVSADYLLGRSDSATLNEDIQMMVKHTGLSEKSIETLKKLNSIPKMGTDITNNIYRLKALDFLLSDENAILTLKLIGDYLFGDYAPYYEDPHTLEDVKQKNLDDNLWYYRRQEYSDLTDEEFYEFMQKNVWVNCVPLSKNEKPVPEPISIDDIKASVLVRVNQALRDCYKYLRNDEKGKQFLKHVIGETVRLYNENR